MLEDVDYVVKEDMTLIAHPNTYLPLSGYMVFGDSLMVTASGNSLSIKPNASCFEGGGK